MALLPLGRVSPARARQRGRRPLRCGDRRAAGDAHLAGRVVAAALREQLPDERRQRDCSVVLRAGGPVAARADAVDAGRSPRPDAARVPDASALPRAVGRARGDVAARAHAAQRAHVRSAPAASSRAHARDRGVLGARSRVTFEERARVRVGRRTVFARVLRRSVRDGVPSGPRSLHASVRGRRRRENFCADATRCIRRVRRSDRRRSSSPLVAPSRCEARNDRPHGGGARAQLPSARGDLSAVGSQLSSVDGAGRALGTVARAVAGARDAGAGRRDRRGRGRVRGAFFASARHRVGGASARLRGRRHVRGHARGVLVVGDGHGPVLHAVPRRHDSGPAVRAGAADREAARTAGARVPRAVPRERGARRVAGLRAVGRRSAHRRDE